MADVQAEPLETATSLMPIRSASPSTPEKLRFRLFGRRWVIEPLTPVPSRLAMIASLSLSRRRARRGPSSGISFWQSSQALPRPTIPGTLSPENIIRAIQENALPIETVVGVSTDKACKPVNAMGMTKALQERVFIQANIRCPKARFICVRYGNVLASRGSVIPLFHDQIRNGGPVTITTPEMTRFLISLDDAVDTVFAAFADARPGEIFVPRAPSARSVDVAEALIGDRPIDTQVTGIRPGEKIHEIMVSDEEAPRTVEHGKWYAILPM